MRGAGPAPWRGAAAGSVTVSVGDSTSRHDCVSSRILAANSVCSAWPCAVRNQMAEHWIADERQVANGVENLVTDKLVFEPQGVVQHARLAQHDRVIERPAERQAVLPQHLDVLQERERARRRDLLEKGLLGDAQRPGLMPQERVVVADAVGDLEML